MIKLERKKIETVFTYKKAVHNYVLQIICRENPESEINSRKEIYFDMKGASVMLDMKFKTITITKYEKVEISYKEVEKFHNIQQDFIKIRSWLH